MSAEENRDSGPATRVCHVCQERKYVAGNVNGFYFCLDCACRVGELANMVIGGFGNKLDRIALTALRLVQEETILEDKKARGEPKEIGI